MRASSDLDLILIYGHDEMLQATRRQILLMLGVSVLTVGGFSEFCTAAADEDPAVILLCQTLLPEECLEAETFAQKNAPQAKVLVLYNRIGKCRLSGNHNEFYVGNGPAALMRTVSEMIAATTTGASASLRQ